MFKCALFLTLTKGLCALSLGPVQTIFETTHEIEDIAIVSSLSGENAFTWLETDEKDISTAWVFSTFEKKPIPVARLSEAKIVCSYVSSEGTLATIIKSTSDKNTCVDHFDIDLSARTSQSHNLFKTKELDNVSFTFLDAFFDQTGQRHLFYERKTSDTKKGPSYIFGTEYQEIVYTSDHRFLNANSLFLASHTRNLLPTFSRYHINLTQDGRGFILVDNYFPRLNEVKIQRFKNFETIGELESYKIDQQVGLLFHSTINQKGHGGLLVPSDTRIDLFSFADDQKTHQQTFTFDEVLYSNASIAIDEAGNLMASAVVEQDDNYYLVTFFKRPHEDWQSMPLFDRPLKRKECFFSPRLTSDYKGHFVLSYFNETAKSQELWSSLFDSETGSWQEPMLLIPQSERCYDYQFDFSQDKEAHILFLNSSGKKTYLNFAKLND